MRYEWGLGAIVAVLFLLIVVFSSSLPLLKLDTQKVPLTGNSIAEEKVAAKSIIQSQADLEISATITHPVNILGKAGFNPEELVLDAGDSVTWINADPQKEDIVLVIQREGTREFRTTKAIRRGEQTTLIFPEIGRFGYWSVAYGKKGLVVVR